MNLYYQPIFDETVRYENRPEEIGVLYRDIKHGYIVAAVVWNLGNIIMYHGCDSCLKLEYHNYEHYKLQLRKGECSLFIYKYTETSTFHNSHALKKVAYYVICNI